MKKFASLLAGVAVAAVAMPALAGPAITQGSVFVQSSNSSSSDATKVAEANTNSAWTYPTHSSLMVVRSAGFYNNNGHAQTNVGATFDLVGKVTPDCAYYVGDTKREINFGEIGIHAIDANPNIAFKMNSYAPRVYIDTNLAGCNTRNRVTITKANLKNWGAASLGFDSTQFTDEIRFNAVANYKAGAVGATTATAGDQFTVGYGDTTNYKNHGAWKSPLRVTMAMETPASALVAGTYNGRVVINLAAY